MLMHWRRRGCRQLARNLAVQWGPKGVRANAIAPGFIATELSAPLLSDEGIHGAAYGDDPAAPSGPRWRTLQTLPVSWLAKRRVSSQDRLLSSMVGPW